MERMEVRINETNSEQYERIASIEGSYEDLDNRVRRNTTIISGFSIGSGAVLTAISAKLADLLNWI
ncbi:hypothetical protein DV707_10725 [Halobellus limi]|uniref:Uncharacterized protein n=2 Tax=Halobellus limi TaxID=699433 RepID=A0A1H5ZI77_9EURY|nr:hypothetical protein DV707_10725 [Halobellus limi]SEG35734.1 hypothetical protein SAMN04488133_2000 [Halobellus limi]